MRVGSRQDGFLLFSSSFLFVWTPEREVDVPTGLSGDLPPVSARVCSLLSARGAGDREFAPTADRLRLRLHVRLRLRLHVRIPIRFTTI